MNIHKWQLLHYIFDNEVTAWEYATAFDIAIHTARVRMLRANLWGWLYRRKDGGIYFYSLSQKAWEFYEKFGSFTEHPYYGWGSKTPRPP